MQTKEIDFTNQTIYVGIDVHKKSWSVTLISSGMYLKTYSMNPNPLELAKYLRNNYPNATYKSVYEAGFSGYWIDRKLRENGIENIIVSPGDVPTSNKERRRRTDKVDSKKLARELENGRLEAIYVPSKAAEMIRSLNRQRIQLTRDNVRTKNRIKMWLHYYNIEIPTNSEVRHWSKRFIKYLQAIEFEDPIGRYTLDQYIEDLLDKRNRILSILRKLREIHRGNETIKKLLTVPGVGFITAVTLYTEIIDINRFGGINQLSPFVGLAPGMDNSGEKERVTGLSKQKNKYLRNYLIEASWVAIRQDPALTMAYGNLKQRMVPQKAIIRIAKKLLNRIIYVWKNQEEYVYSVAA